MGKTIDLSDLVKTIFIKWVFPQDGQMLVEQFSKTTAAKEKDRTSVIFHDKTTNGQNFSTKLQTALPNSLDHLNSLQNYKQPS